MLSSAYKRHGSIIENAIVASIQSNPRYEVWRVERFGIQQQALTTVAAALLDPGSLDHAHLPYVGDGQGDSSIQIDAVVFDRETHIVSSYEIKRGNGHFDAGKKRSMMRDALLSKILLRSHCIAKGWEAIDSKTYVIFYYGVRSIPAPIGLIGEELDAHFGAEIHDDIEEVNGYFRGRLFEII
ncbi:MAG: hypothetical protein GY788_25180, partial [bacterium]|nr:hypothetical protein [bacterium]